MKTACCLLLSLAAFLLPASGQHLEGHFSLTTRAGYLTNAYLDPAFPFWERSAQTVFAGLEPQAGLQISGRSRSINVHAAGRLTTLPQGESPWALARLQTHFRQSLSSRVLLQLYAGGLRVQAPTEQWLGWGSASLSWRPATSWRWTLSGGTSLRRYDATDTFAALTQRALYGQLSTTIWPSDPWQLTAALHAGTTDAEGPVSLGGHAEIGRHLTPSLRGALRVATDRIRYGRLDRTDRLMRAGVRLNWQGGRFWSLALRGGVQRYAPDSALDSFLDTYAAAALTLALRTGRRRATPRRPLWKVHDGTVRIQVPYDGSGSLYLAGDFNGWDPARQPLEPDGDGYYSTILSLQPGTYHYKVRVVEGDRTRWLDLPPRALTAADGFGGRNGLLIVPEKEND